MIDDVRELLGLKNGEQNEILTTIIKVTEDRLKSLIGTETVPGKLSYIVTEVSVARFNRIGSEGLTSHSVEGESMSWSTDDFEPFRRDIEDFLKNKDKSTQGKVRFI